MHLCHEFINNCVLFCRIIRHIQEDVNAQQLPTEQKVEEMTEEERNYLYFKVHDLDGNGKLDGLEIFYSATHHAASHESHDHTHEHSEGSGTGDTTEVQASETNQQSNDSNSNISNLKLLELDENGQIVNANINHIIGWLPFPFATFLSTVLNCN